MITSSNKSVSFPEAKKHTEPYFLSGEESKYSFHDQSESHTGSIDIAINAINIIPDNILISVPTDIYIYTDNDSVDYSDPVNS